jgi:hypothetical protein
MPGSFFCMMTSKLPAGICAFLGKAVLLSFNKAANNTNNNLA